jgi:hypothetical protein
MIAREERVRRLIDGFGFDEREAVFDRRRASLP